MAICPVRRSPRFYYHPMKARRPGSWPSHLVGVAAPRFVRQNQGFKVAKAILDAIQPRRDRKKRYHRRSSAVYDPRKVTLAYLPNELIYMAMRYLDKPSIISLGLTSKFFAKIVTALMSTRLNDQPSLVRYHKKCIVAPCTLTIHVTDRRILMLMLKSWMPHGNRLCWVCLKYSKSTSGKWHHTTAGNHGDVNRINVPAILAQNMSKLWCHHHCLQSARQLRAYVWNVPGAMGGFRSFGSLRILPVDDDYVYDAGF